MMRRSQFYGLLPNIIIPLSGFSTDIYTPSMPAMANELQVDDISIKFTITAYLIAMGIAQLFAGPVSDALGRKKLMFSAVFAYFLSTLVIVLSHSVESIIGARFIQGFCSAFLIVPGRAILNDCFSGEELKKRFNTMTISFALAPIMAPFIGGYCQHFWGWRASFMFLLAYSAILCVIITCFYQESLVDKKTFKFKQIRENYLVLLSDKRFLHASLFLSILFGYNSMITVLSSFIFQDHLGVSALLFGYIALTFGVGWFAGNLMNRFMFDVSVTKRVSFTLGCQGIFILLLLVTALFGVYHFYLCLVCFFMLVFATALSFPLFVAEALSLFPALAGSSNACLFAMTWLAFSVYSMIAALISVDSLIPLGSIFLGIYLFSLWYYFKFVKPLNLH